MKFGSGTSLSCAGRASGRASLLYVSLDIFSRYGVGWMIASRETAELAEKLIADSVAHQHLAPGSLTLHADRGTRLRSN
ncbi:MAG: hypothetical protein ABIP67_01550 [Burkholderiales bacterium]